MTVYRWFAVLVLLTIGLLESSRICSAVELLVSDMATSSVLAFDGTTGAFRRVVVAPDLNDPDNPNNLNSPTAMAIGFGGDLFVTSQGSGKVMRYNRINGAPKGTAPGSSVFLDIDELLEITPPQSSSPAGLLYDSANDRLFVSLLGSFNSTIIKIFDSSGGVLGTIDSGPAAGRTGMALDPSGNLYVSSLGFGGADSAILKYTETSPNMFGAPSTVISGAGAPFPIVLAGMNGLTLDGDDLYAASMFGQQVIKLTNDTLSGGFGSHTPPTAYPSSILVHGDKLLVSTLGNNNPGDQIYGNHLFPGSVQAFDLNNPMDMEEFITVDPEGAFLPTSMLLVSDPTPGDFDGDGDVDGADFSVWQENFPKTSGATLATGDADGDRDVDGADFIIWQVNFPSPEIVLASPVPEPMGWMLVVIGMGSWAARRKICPSQAA